MNGMKHGGCPLLLSLRESLFCYGVSIMAIFCVGPLERVCDLRIKRNVIINFALFEGIKIQWFYAVRCLWKKWFFRVFAGF